MIKKLFNLIKPKTTASTDDIFRDLMRREAIIGGKLFGNIKPGNRREFFCLDEHTWVWHEEWVDEDGQRHVTTTRYDVRPNGVLKAQGNHQYSYINQQEARNLYTAVDLYNKTVDTSVAANS
jgi:hypothetical protein